MPGRNRIWMGGVGLLALVGGLVWPESAWAAGEVDTGDTAWIITSCAFVLLMTPGLALFYGGMVRTKNVLSTMMYSFIAMGVITIQWVVIGYSIAFGNDIGGFMGGFNYAFLQGVGPEAQDGSTIPHLVFMMFQMMFAIITPALISGAMVERTKFGAYTLFILLWATLVYDPVCHWVWGGGWLGDKGALDFAGGTVVHAISGVSALVAAIYIGKRRGWPQTPLLPHNLTLTVLGAGILWFGWFGFNAGSALASGGGAAIALAATHIAAGSAAASWALVERIHRGKASMLGVATGIVAGLVVITPAAGFVSPISAMIMGLLVSPVCYLAIAWAKMAFKYDDSLDAFGVHGVGGIFGAIVTGVFAQAAWGGAEGVLDGNWMQLWVQTEGVVVACIYAAIVTLIILFALDKTLGLRVDEDEEEQGLDLVLHGEKGYEI